MSELVELPKVEKTGMEQSIDCLQNTELDVNDFYCITVRKSGVSYQGSFNSNIVKSLIEKGYKHGFNSQGYVELSNGINEITLT
jgi:hypothetical protein